MALRMRQSLAQYEAEFRDTAVEERERRERLRKQAAVRERTRRVEKVHKHGTMRFVALVFAILLTAVVVTVVMFQTLALVVGG
ncbi:MAG: hypothetical protein H0V29_09185 [Thermoleophilaceae bacterium]|nr:hypothetical protein [Thermoleophilaceae bacterium]